MKPQFVLFLTLSLLCLGTGAALAQTPDWMTPAEETICDSETGAAFGLCNAYCEAMDCENANPQASATACTKVKDKFTNITGRPLPCETCPPPPPGTTCPCVDAFTAYNTVLNTSTPLCAGVGTLAVKQTDNAYIAATCNLNQPSGGGCGVFESSGSLSVLNITPEEGSACIYQILESCNLLP